METEIKINHLKAETIYISHPTSSYAIFCFNDVGDLFVNSDYGSYCFAWRHYGTDRPFKEFLSKCTAEYIVGKFAINHTEVSRKKFPPIREKHLLVLVQIFIDQLKKNS